MDDKTIEKKVKEAAREVTERVEQSSAKAAEGLHDCQTAIWSATQANINAMFEYMQQAFNAKSMPELMELSTKHARRQMEMMTEQAKDIVGAAQKATAESVRPLTNGFTNPFGRMS
jgi:hypothetical protein